jgi:hypothetical protein
MGVQMTQHALKWCIFAMLVLTVPVIFYVFMWIGVLPVAGIIAMSATAGDFLLAVVGLVHVALFGGMFYGIAVLISRACAEASGRVRLGVAAIIGIALGVVTLQPWYDVGDGFHSLHYVLLHR